MDKIFSLEDLVRINRKINTTNQLIVLLLLAQATEPVSGTSLGETCGIASCTIDSAARRLIEAGWISRYHHPENRDRYYEITTAGKNLIRLN